MTLTDQQQEKLLIKALMCDWEYDYTEEGTKTSTYLSRKYTCKYATTKDGWKGEVSKISGSTISLYLFFPPQRSTKWEAELTTPSGKTLELSSDRAKVLYDVLTAERLYKWQQEAEEAEAKSMAEIARCIGD